MDNVLDKSMSSDPPKDRTDLWLAAVTATYERQVLGKKTDGHRAWTDSPPAKKSTLTRF